MLDSTDLISELADCQQKHLILRPPQPTHKLCDLLCESSVHRPT